MAGEAETTLENGTSPKTEDRSAQILDSGKDGENDMKESGEEEKGKAGTDPKQIDEPSDETKATNVAPLSDIERIKAAQAARRNRRSRSSRQLPLPPTAISVSSTSSSEPNKDDAELKKLREEATNLRIEMGSLRRNHLQNIKALTAERDMFARQLAKEQNSSKPNTHSTRSEEDLSAQLRAARTRNTNLESENAELRDEVKQLNFRVQAARTLDAASDGYEKIVDDLVKVKLQCAQLQEEKEHLLMINKDLMSTTAKLTEANGDLESSRSEWVLKCADLERERHELKQTLKATTNKIEQSDSGSLQNVSL